jgi:hypothetical protein
VLGSSRKPACGQNRPAAILGAYLETHRRGKPLWESACLTAPPPSSPAPINSGCPRCR